jgi:hypothetical protein
MVRSKGGAVAQSPLLSTPLPEYIWVTSLLYHVNYQGIWLN